MTSSLNSPPELETSQAAGRLWVFGPHLATWATADPTQIRTYRAVRATARRSASEGPEAAALARNIDCVMLRSAPVRALGSYPADWRRGSGCCWRRRGESAETDRNR